MLSTTMMTMMMMREVFKRRQVGGRGRGGQWGPNNVILEKRTKRGGCGVWGKFVQRTNFSNFLLGTFSLISLCCTLSSKNSNWQLIRWWVWIKHCTACEIQLKILLGEDSFNCTIEKRFSVAKHWQIQNFVWCLNLKTNVLAHIKTFTWIEISSSLF